MGGVPTHVLSLRNDPAGDEAKVPLVVIVPGSPGMGHFYLPFAHKLFDLGEGRYDVSVVSHAGHSLLDTTKMLPVFRDLPQRKDNMAV